MKRKKIRIMQLKVKKPEKVNLYLGKHRNDLKLNWEQVKKRYPRIKKYADSDFDGTLNARDCKPLNPAQDARITDWLKKKMIKKRGKELVSELKKERFKKFTKKVREVQIGKRLAGVPVKAKKGERSVGRPAGKFKHVSPLTGQRVPATVYYSHRREVRRRMRMRAERTDIREQAIMARRGISPQTTRIRQQMREQVPQQIPETPIQQVQQIPIQQIPRYPTQPVLPQQRFRVVTDIMTGRQIIKSIPPPERWVR